MSEFLPQPALYFYWIIIFRKRKNLSVFQAVWYSIMILQLPAYKILVLYHFPHTSKADNESNSIRYAVRSHLEMSNKTASYFSNWKQ